MTTFATIVGYLILALLALALCLWMAERLWLAVAEWHERRVIRAVERQLRYQAQLMRGQGHFFSPDHQLAAVWEACADAMACGQFPDALRVRRQLPTIIEKLQQEALH